MINFYKASNSEKVTHILYRKIIHHLSEGHVLWLVAGGSSIEVAVNVSKLLAGEDNLSRLTISLTDERFGSVGHNDSNWQQLIKAGFILKGANLVPVLDGSELTHTVDSYSQMLQAELGRSAYSVALAGMGGDGHIFGIMPHSPAIDNAQLVVGYDWADFIRLTPTISFIKQLDEIIINAFGAEKHDQLDRIEQEVSVREQPAQLLKQAKQVLIYNEYKGEQL